MGLGVALALVCYWPLFGHLQHWPIRLWDESRNTMNAMEMYQNEFSLTLWFQGAPDFWNTKPPLLIWLQTGFMHVFGPGELAVRLPSALAGLGTVFLLLWFSIRALNRPMVGFISGICLITFQGYVGHHGTRTGDFDALLTFFLTGGILLVFLWHLKSKARYLLLGFLFFGLAAMTKGVVALFAGPGLFLFLWQHKKIKVLLSSSAFYKALLLFPGIPLLYYLIAGLSMPGYLEAMFYNEIGGRYGESLEGHTGGFDYYLDLWFNGRIHYFYWLFFPSLAIGLSAKSKKRRQLARLAAWQLLCIFLIISTAGTKIPSYDMPVYPMLALVFGLSIDWFARRISEIKKPGLKYPREVIGGCVIFLLLIGPYSKIAAKQYFPKELPLYADFYPLSYYLKQQWKQGKPIQDVRIVWDGYAAHLLPYIQRAQWEGQRVDFCRASEVKPGMLVWVGQAKLYQSLNQQFHTQSRPLTKGVWELLILKPINP